MKSYYVCFHPVCVPGTLFNGEVCEDCMFGYWNDEYNQTACQPCGGGRNTMGNGTVTELGCGENFNFLICVDIFGPDSFTRPILGPLLSLLWISGHLLIT